MDNVENGMYFPKQIPYLLDKEFKKYIEYTEYNLKELEDYCMCIWEMKSKQRLDKNISNQILPDACIDIVIDFVNHTICFAGFSKETEDFQLSQKIDYMGVRLKPGSFYSFFQIDADKIMDQMIPFSEIEKDFNLAEILSLNHTPKRIECLKKYLLKKIESKPKKDFVAIVNELYRNPNEQNVIKIAEKLGYNERQLFRVFKKNYGVSPKVLLNIVRLHLCLTLLLEQNINLVDIAMQCGFYDQSHFIKEIKRYTGISPLKLMQQYQA